MKPITHEDLSLINTLKSRTYTGLSLSSNSSEAERHNLKTIKKKLKDITEYYAHKYNGVYGPFETSISSGNPITRSNTFNNVWGGIFKGASNKQYAAQISFVMDDKKPCLN